MRCQRPRDAAVQLGPGGLPKPVSLQRRGLAKPEATGGVLSWCWCHVPPHWAVENTPDPESPELVPETQEGARSLLGCPGGVKPAGAALTKPSPVTPQSCAPAEATAPLAPARAVPMPGNLSPCHLSPVSDSASSTTRPGPSAPARLACDHPSAWCKSNRIRLWRQSTRLFFIQKSPHGEEHSLTRLLVELPAPHVPFDSPHRLPGQLLFTHLLGKTNQTQAGASGLVSSLAVRTGSKLSEALRPGRAPVAGAARLGDGARGTLACGWRAQLKQALIPLTG